MCFSWWNWGWSSIFSWLFYRTWFFYNHDQPCIKYQFPRARGEVLNNRGNRRNRPNAWLARMPSDEFSNVWWYINLDIHESVQKKHCAIIGMSHSDHCQVVTDITTWTAVQRDGWPSSISSASNEQCSKPLLVYDYGGLYYLIHWGLQ